MSHKGDREPVHCSSNLINDPFEPIGCTRFVSREKVRAPNSTDYELIINCEDERVTAEYVPLEDHAYAETLECNGKMAVATGVGFVGPAVVN